MDIKWIRHSIRSGKYEISGHAEEERQEDEIGIADLESALLTGEILEQYPNDVRDYSCLVLGFSRAGVPIHIVIGKTNRNELRVITVYIPTAPKWIDPKTRRIK